MSLHPPPPHPTPKWKTVKGESVFSLWRCWSPSGSPRPRAVSPWWTWSRWSACELRCHPCRWTPWWSSSRCSGAGRFLPPPGQTRFMLRQKPLEAPGQTVHDMLQALIATRTNSFHAILETFIATKTVFMLCFKPSQPPGQCSCYTWNSHSHQDSVHAILETLIATRTNSVHATLQTLIVTRTVFMLHFKPCHPNKQFMPCSKL